ncbi:NADP-dependent 3-hydroxy acid dehydrogenase YdfG [Neisseria sp. HSC-16F19]|nr:SDR family NAD(P)-dependent oxidoreductase [Neisseria sp. HSC-16F19]MCP2040117.1 NADP-dependent 3-hydroxy acid dehydrogenase YdfG [Neisseria sp. HSC-16F19]
MTTLVIISGHSAGLGAALAAHYLTQGHAVLGLARRSLPPQNRLQQQTLDLADNAALAAYLASADWRNALADKQHIILINNAATVAPSALCGRQDAAAIARAVALNITAPLLLTNAVLADAAAGCLKTVVHIGSGAGRKAYPGWSVYGAAKAALDHHAAVVAAEDHAGVRIASIAPGVIDTAMQAAIRASDTTDFPLQPQFVQLQHSGSLQSAGETAGRLAALIQQAGFGQQTRMDVRD